MENNEQIEPLEHAHELCSFTMNIIYMVVVMFFIYVIAGE